MQEQIFVGRERQLDELKGYLDKALAAQGQVCFVTGQAGSGKTALVRYFVEQAFTADPHLVVAMGSCNAQTGIGDPYLPFREALAMLTGDASSKQRATRVTPENSNRLRAVLVRSVQVLVEAAPELIGVFVPGGNLVGALGKALVTRVGWMDKLELLAKKQAAPAAEQSRIFEQYTAFLQRLSTEVPLILFLDDLQWADSASLSLLFHLGRRIENSRILILGAYRPDDVALGRNGERHPLEPVVHELARYYGDVTVALDAIPERVNRQFVDALLDSEPNGLGEGFRTALFHQTSGHALFTVELIQDMQERGDLVRDGDGRWVESPSLDWHALPARVEGVIAERIDRLDEKLKEMLTVASVEGEEFTAEVVARVQAMAELETIRQLSGELDREHHLVRAQGLVRFGDLQLSLYRFLHNLFQQYLYGNLDEAERTYLHRDVGQVLETLFAGQTEEVAAQLARHFEEAGMPAKAAAYRLQAGNRAHGMSAHQEAGAHLKRGLELLTDLPQGPERLQLELGLQTALGTALIATDGYASPKVEEAFARARELSRALGDPPELFQVLYGQLVFHLVRAEMERTYREGEQFLTQARQVGNKGYVVASHALLGVTATYLARYDDAHEHLAQTLALYDSKELGDLARQLGQDPEVIALCYLAWILWLQGYPEQAITKGIAALALARKINHLYTHALTAVGVSNLWCMLRQWPECEAEAKVALQLSSQGGFALMYANALMMDGIALVHQGHGEQGIAELVQGIGLSDATGSGLTSHHCRALLAEAYLVAGRREEGLKAIADALSSADLGSQGWWLPEQYRVRAELLLLEPGSEAEAEASLRQALDLARSQKSKSLELRAATSLARLLRKQGRAAEGRDLLAECYAWFTEGFDTPDLQEARELLEELIPTEERTRQPLRPSAVIA
jgi:predicted ATPase